MADVSSTDGSFRRALFVLLVVIGVFAAAAFLHGREVGSDLKESERQRAALSGQLDQLLANQEQILAEAEQAESEAATRQAALEKAIGTLLAGSSDPVVARAARDAGFMPTTAPPTEPAPSPDPAPSTAPAAPPAPQPTPQPGLLPDLPLLPPSLNDLLP